MPRPSRRRRGSPRPDGELQKHKQALQSISSQALQTRASLETLKKDQSALDELRDQLREAQTEIKASHERTEGLKTDFEQLRSMSGQLTTDYTKLKDLSREIARRGQHHRRDGQGCREASRPRSPRCRR